MKRKLTKEDKQEIVNVATGAFLGVIIGIIVIGAVIAGLALYSYLRYWR